MYKTNLLKFAAIVLTSNSLIITFCLFDMGACGIPPPLKPFRELRTFQPRWSRWWSLAAQGSSKWYIWDRIPATFSISCPMHPSWLVWPSLYPRPDTHTRRRVQWALKNTSAVPLPLPLALSVSYALPSLSSLFVFVLEERSSFACSLPRLYTPGSTSLEYVWLGNEGGRAKTR